MVAKTITVSSATGLTNALKSATGGETIYLKPGNYGSLNLSNINPASTVQIESQSLTNKAQFSYLQLWSSSNLTFKSLDMANPISGNTSQDTYGMYINYGKNIDLVKMDFHGSLNNNSWDDARGLRVSNSKDVQITNSDFHDLKVGIVSMQNYGVSITGNNLHELREGINIVDNDHLLIDHNQISDINPTATDHSDAIQIFTGSNYNPSSDVTISNNSILQGGGGYAHGIFVQSERPGYVHSNLLIENNVYSGVATHGIYLAAVDGAIVRGNTIVSSPQANWTASINVQRTSNVTIEDNVSTGYYDGGGNTGKVMTNNITAHKGGPLDATNVNSLLVNPLKSGSINPADFAVKVGSKADLLDAGMDYAAFKAIPTYAYYDQLTHSLAGGVPLNHIV